MVSAQVTLSRQGVGTLDLTSYTDPLWLAGAHQGWLPPEVQNRWHAGAGDGETFRGARVLGRRLPLPLALAGTHEQITGRLSLLARLLAPRGLEMAQLALTEPSSQETWTLPVVRDGEASGGTQFTDWATLSLWLRSGDPFWTRRRWSSFAVSATSGPAAGLLTGSLSELNVASAQAQGSRTVHNDGDADAYPVWQITGPAAEFTATLETSGAAWSWAGSLGAGESLTVDTRAGTVVDHVGTNRYGEIGPAPVLWPLPPAASAVSVDMSGGGASSQVICRWRPRRWSVM